MTQFIRRDVPGGTFFFTVRLQDQRSDLLTARIGLLRDVVRLCQKQAPFRIDAAVILPAELHMIWTLPAGDADVAGRWRMIKSTFARHVPVSGDMITGAGIWAREGKHHPIRDAEDFALHMHLIATAPVRAGLVQRATDWPYASWQSRKGTAFRTIAPVPSSPDPATAVPAM
ncbi:MULTISPECIES: REP-associated tyrosine transposase [unclassified Yoonia]|uniref:REP-associated tyrosine transposase n=1 Tax=unclassified Yoonia TaxID=2629118 RepID=UPI002B000E49|nr:MULTISPECIES: transposase [unclassified Yoonia]